MPPNKFLYIPDDPYILKEVSKKDFLFATKPVESQEVELLRRNT